MAAAIHPNTRIGQIHLAVSNLSRSIPFYQEAIGLSLLSQKDGQAWLGAPRPDHAEAPQPLLLLSEQPGARRVRGVSGLYHFALRVPSRPELAQAITRLSHFSDSLQGVADHGVSEAIYLADPDGIGIEIYRDRPRSEWPRKAGGALEMVTEPLDLDGVLGALGQQVEAQAAPRIEIGHVHLHVSRLQEAIDFYAGVLGFELMQRYGPSAAFLSAGGYHHHIGVNTWAGESAPPPPENAAGLRWYSIELPDPQALEETLGRVKQAGVPVEDREEGALVHDPAQNAILLRTPVG